MASLTKQQKRAKRAKVKAKQHRIDRSTHSPAEKYDALAPEFFETIFTTLQNAESISRKDLFVTTLITIDGLFSLSRDLQREMDKTDDPSELMIRLTQNLMIDYRKWAYLATEVETLEWLCSPEVLEDFTQAVAETNELTADSLEGEAPIDSIKPDS